MTKVKSLPILGAILTVGILCLVSGCSNPENETKQVVPTTPEQKKQFQDQQIKSIQDNPNIPADQKQRIIGMYQGGGEAQAQNPAAHVGK